MNEERWQQIHEVLHAALELPAADRAAYLDAACTGDAPLRREVDSLLEAASSTGGAFDRLAEDFVGGDDGTVPEHVGPYRVLREVGRGGMGVVYLGEGRDDDLHRPVAVKVFHAGPGGPDMVDRFLAERRILSRLDHPNIARLHSGGVTEDGRPYFAMEHVEGRPIGEYCDAHGLDVDARLRLFLDVAEAVQHAHRHLVIHRDLKPSNILVTERGEVKLLDFGIAKLIDEGAGADGSSPTITSVRVMTPEYASPEQVRGEAVTTATDVYQLGVLLYELLTGRRPYRVPRRLLHELERVICTEPPERPSAVLSDDPGPTRGATTDRRRRRLAGDLDTIVLMAMRKEPERRYASVDALIDDLRRHLDGRPVRARPDTLGYRTTKFVRRHRLAVATAAVVAALVVAFGVAAAEQARRIAAEKVRAERVTEFLVQLFENADPAASLGATPSVRDLLDEGVRRVRYDLPEQPLVRAALLDAMGRAYGGLGLVDVASPLLDEALALREEHLGSDDPDVTLSLRSVARLAFDRAGDVEQRRAVRTRLEDVLRRLRRAHGERHLSVAEAHSDLGLSLQMAGEYEAARSQYDSALHTLRLLEGADARVQETITLTNLGWISQAEGDLAHADSLFGAVLALRRELYPGDHPRLARSLSTAADIRRRRGDPEGAEPLAREAVEMLGRLYPEPHLVRADALLGLGNILHDGGDRAAADSTFRAALAMLRAVLPEDNDMVARVLNDWASLRLDRGDFAAADSLFEAAVEIDRRILGDEHLFTLLAQGNLADTRRRSGRLDEAEALYRSIVSRMESTSAPDLELASMRTALGSTLLGRDRPAEAEGFLQRAFDVQRDALPERDSRRLTTQSLLGLALLQLGRYEEAEPLLVAYHDVVLDATGPDNSYVQWVRGLLVQLYDGWGRPEQADPFRVEPPGGAESR